MDKAVELTLHNVVANYASTNVEHDTARWLLVRVYIYQAQCLIDGESVEGHLPALTTPTGIIHLLYLQSFTILCTAFDTASYAKLVEGCLPIRQDRFDEIRVAWKTAESLLIFVKQHFIFSPSIEVDHIDFQNKSIVDEDAPQDFTEAAMVCTNIT